MNPRPLKGTTMYFVDIENPFGTSAFDAPTAGTVKPHKLPRTSKKTRSRKSPIMPSTILKNILAYNG